MTEKKETEARVNGGSVATTPEVKVSQTAYGNFRVTIGKTTIMLFMGKKYGPFWSRWPHNEHFDELEIVER